MLEHNVDFLGFFRDISIVSAVAATVTTVTYILSTSKLVIISDSFSDKLTHSLQLRTHNDRTQ
jgi:hypothetical protein